MVHHLVHLVDADLGVDGSVGHVEAQVYAVELDGLGKMLAGQFHIDLADCPDVGEGDVAVAGLDELLHGLDYTDGVAAVAVDLAEVGVDDLQGLADILVLVGGDAVPDGVYLAAQLLQGADGQA